MSKGDVEFCKSVTTAAKHKRRAAAALSVRRRSDE
jgi:hypothetical protein